MPSSLFYIQLLLLFIAHFVKTGFCCIGFGGCSFLGYPAAAYRCGPAYYSAYYPAAGCYGAYCRNRLKGAPILALNESAMEEGNEDENGGINGKAAMGEGGKRHSAQSTGAQDGNGRDGFGEMQVSPDALFFECCQSWSLPSQCLLKCSFANYSAETLRSMFLRSDECPIESASIIHFCASQNRDHRPCCLQAGIDQTKAGQKCLIFCDQMPQNETRLDLGYLPCFERFSEMKRCFYENAIRTIDYLEAELEEIRRGQNVNANSPDVEDLDGETKEVGGGFTIGRPPIIFVNDISPKHPRINDDYFEEESEDRDLIGKRRKRINKRN